jgi:hypothetical protein
MLSIRFRLCASGMFVSKVILLLRAAREVRWEVTRVMTHHVPHPTANEL